MQLTYRKNFRGFDNGLSMGQELPLKGGWSPFRWSQSVVSPQVALAAIFGVDVNFLMSRKLMESRISIALFNLSVT